MDVLDYHDKVRQPAAWNRQPGMMTDLYSIYSIVDSGLKNLVRSPISDHSEEGTVLTTTFGEVRQAAQHGQRVARLSTMRYDLMGRTVQRRVPGMVFSCLPVCACDAQGGSLATRASNQQESE